jgi:hypothetical protein
MPQPEVERSSSQLVPYTHIRTLLATLQAKKNKLQGMCVLFPYTHHLHSLSHPSSRGNKTLNILCVFTHCEALGRSKYQPSLTFTP